jgi:hypothetical protein
MKWSAEALDKVHDLPPQYAAGVVPSGAELPPLSEVFQAGSEDEARQRYMQQASWKVRVKMARRLGKTLDEGLIQVRPVEGIWVFDVDAFDDSVFDDCETEEEMIAHPDALKGLMAGPFETEDAAFAWRDEDGSDLLVCRIRAR